MYMAAEDCIHIVKAVEMKTCTDLPVISSKITKAGVEGEIIIFISTAVLQVQVPEIPDIKMGDCCSFHYLGKAKEAIKGNDEEERKFFLHVGGFA